MPDYQLTGNYFSTGYWAGYFPNALSMPTPTPSNLVSNNMANTVMQLRYRYIREEDDIMTIMVWMLTRDIQ